MFRFAHRSPLASLLAVTLLTGGCSISGNDPNPPDTDGDGIPDRLELAHGLDPRDPADAALDPDGDQLPNLDEIMLHDTDIAVADTDGDGLGDGGEVVAGTDPHLTDTDEDELTDGAEVISIGSNPLLVDTDGDTIGDGVEVNGFTLYDKTTEITTDPVSADTDADGLHDGLERAVQDAFSGYASASSAATFLTGSLHPNNTVTKPNLGGLSFVVVSLTPAALEQDPDGDGKPTIEELFHATNPNDAGSEFLYAYEQSADGTLKQRHQALAAASFVLVPGGWDVDGDGAVEPAFYLAKYEAKSTGIGVTDTASLPELIAGTVVYSGTSKRFVDRLCNNASGGSSTDAGTSDSGGACRGNRYVLTGTDLATPSTVNTVTFAAGGTPYASLGWLQARLVLRESPVDAAAAAGGPYPIDLPTEAQNLQVVRLAINHAENWVGGTVGTGLLFQGHTDNTPASTLATGDPTNPYDQTGNSGTSGATQRRTLILANGVMARDFTLPLGHRVEVWDFSGNVAEWSRGLIAATHNTSRPSGRAGGERFANGLSELENYTGTNLSGPAGDIAGMPAWWKPVLKNDTTLGTAQGAGAYHDGFSGSDIDGDGKSEGTFSNGNYGYGAAAYVDGYAAIARGGHHGAGTIAGVAAADVQNGLGRTLPQIGFRASAPVQ